MTAVIIKTATTKRTHNDGGNLRFTVDVVQRKTLFYGRRRTLIFAAAIMILWCPREAAAITIYKYIRIREGCIKPPLPLP